MSKKQKLGIGLIILFILIVFVFALYKSTKKVPYIECTPVGKNGEAILEMYDNNFTIEQEIKIPYKMFYGVSLKIGTYGRENNSRYELIVMDKTTNKQVAVFEFNTSQAKDGQAYELILDSPIEINNTNQFSVMIKAKSIVNNENSVAFYMDQNVENTENLYYNGNLQNADLCMNVYGGNTNIFSHIFTLICEIYVLFIILYALYLYKNHKPIKENSILQAGLVGIISFMLLSVFAGMESFSDETDNIIGGMLIHNGSILYVDYYTQHTPFAYWLCAIFSMFQAASVEQFRLLYYVLISLVYAGIYLRHKNNFGKIKMALLPILQITFGMLIGKETAMILSDNIHAICMIVLVLEFIQYLKDEKLDWKRSIIVSLCVFCSFTSAFVSIYAIFAIGLGVLVKEILYWKNSSSISFKKMITRYWKLVIACAIQFGIMLAYFILTHSLVAFYEQAFKFNTDVYSYYLDDGFGSNIIQPFFIGISNFIHIIPEAMQDIVNNENLVIAIVNIIFGTSLIVSLIKGVHQKEYLKSIILALFISFGFTRTNERFHTIATWASIATIVLIYFDMNCINKKIASPVILGILSIFIISNYMDNCTKYLFTKKQPVNELDQIIISETSDGEKIFYDIYSNPSVYLIYKNRLPINRLGFILPWYMDWYELDTINDLMTKQPRVVVYDEDLKAWEISGYDDYLRKYLHENYKQTSETKKIWILK